MDMKLFEEAFAQPPISADDEEVVRRVIRLMQLSTDLFGVICDHAEDTPVEILDAAEDWYSYLTEVADH